MDHQMSRTEVSTFFVIHSFHFMASFELLTIMTKVLRDRYAELSFTMSKVYDIMNMWITFNNCPIKLFIYANLKREQW
jgi:hypothetical protein